MSNNPLVSVCCITYNHFNFIRECIDSFLMQKTDFPFEICIGEDESSDGTREICKEYADKYPDKIRLFLRTQKESNAASTIPGKHNFIETLKACRGKYIALCEGDDYWTDSLKLQKQVDFLEANPDYSLCFHKVNIFKNGQLIEDYLTREVPETTTIEDLCEGNFIHTPSCVFRNNFKENDIPEILQKTPYGDLTLYIINAQYGKIKKLAEVMGVYRLHSTSLHSSKDFATILESDLKTYNLFIEYFSNKKNILCKLYDFRLRILRAFGELLFDTTIYYNIDNNFHQKNSIILKNQSKYHNETPIFFTFDLNNITEPLRSIRWDPMERPCRCEIQEIFYIDADDQKHIYNLNKITSNGTFYNDNKKCIDFMTSDPQVYLDISGNIKSITIKADLTPKSYYEVTIQDQKFNTRIPNIESRILELTSQLDTIYNSKGWKLLQILYKIASKVIPEGSIRRKIAAKFFYILKKLIQNYRMVKML